MLLSALLFNSVFGYSDVTDSLRQTNTMLAQINTQLLPAYLKGGSDAAADLLEAFQGNSATDPNPLTIPFDTHMVDFLKATTAAFKRLNTAVHVLNSGGEAKQLQQETTRLKALETSLKDQIRQKNAEIFSLGQKVDHFNYQIPIYTAEMEREQNALHTFKETCTQAYDTFKKAFPDIPTTPSATGSFFPDSPIANVAVVALESIAKKREIIAHAHLELNQSQDLIIQLQREIASLEEQQKKLQEELKETNKKLALALGHSTTAKAASIASNAASAASVASIVAAQIVAIINPTLGTPSLSPDPAPTPSIAPAPTTTTNPPTVAATSLPSSSSSGSTVAPTATTSTTSTNTPPSSASTAAAPATPPNTPSGAAAAPVTPPTTPAGATTSGSASNSTTVTTITTSTTTTVTPQPSPRPGTSDETQTETLAAGGSGSSVKSDSSAGSDPSKSPSTHAAPSTLASGSSTGSATGEAGASRQSTPAPEGVTTVNTSTTAVPGAPTSPPPALTDATVAVVIDAGTHSALSTVTGADADNAHSPAVDGTKVAANHTVDSVGGDNQAGDPISPASSAASLSPSPSVSASTSSEPSTPVSDDHPVDPQAAIGSKPPQVGETSSSSEQASNTTTPSHEGIEQGDGVVVQTNSDVGGGAEVQDVSDGHNSTNGEEEKTGGGEVDGVGGNGGGDGVGGDGGLGDDVAADGSKTCGVVEAETPRETSGGAECEAATQSLLESAKGAIEAAVQRAKAAHTTNPTRAEGHVRESAQEAAEAEGANIDSVTKAANAAADRVVAHVAHVVWLTRFEAAKTAARTELGVSLQGTGNINLNNKQADLVRAVVRLLTTDEQSHLGYIGTDNFLRGTNGANLKDKNAFALRNLLKPQQQTS